MTSPLKYMMREIFVQVDYLKKTSVFVTASLIILLNLLFVYFPTGLKFGINPRKRINFHFIKRILKLCSVWYLSKIMLPKFELNTYMGRQFLESCSSPPLDAENVGVVLAPLMIEVM